MMRFHRTCRGNLPELFLLIVFLSLAYVFLQRRGYLGKGDAVFQSLDGLSMRRDTAYLSDQGQMSRHLAREGTSSAGTMKNPLKIDDRIKRVTDSRPKACRTRSYKLDGRVSIIIEFFDYQLYDVKTSLDSVRLNTPPHFVAEYIIVDDGSTLDFIKEDARIYAEKIPNGRLLRMDNREGEGKARMRGAREATSKTLVFLNSNTVVNKGWLEPLLDHLNKEPMSLAVPHFDNINDPISYEYSTTSNNLITVFTWSLTMRMYQNTDIKPSSIEPLDSPICRGDAFAVRKQTFLDLGGYDEDMKDFAAENLELSFRSWMCGGSVKVLPCSRVGVLSLHKPVKISRGHNIRRISEAWLGFRKEFVYKSTNTNSKEKSAFEEEVIKAVKTRSAAKKCKTFEWYLKNIAPHIYTPSESARSYGLLRCGTSTCARIGPDNRVDLGDCKPAKYQLHAKDMIFELTDKKLLKINNKCLAALGSAYVVTTDCKPSDKKHQWRLEPDGRLRNMWSDYCAMHVTDPEKKVKKGRQILMIQECEASVTKFTRWEFQAP